MLLKALAIVFVALTLQVSTVKANECVTVDRFAAGLSKEGIALRGSTAAATEKLAKLFNQNRAARGQPEAQISIFLFGLVTANSGDQAILAAIADKNGCVVPKSVVILTLGQFTDFVTIAGVSISEIIPLDGA